MSQTVTLPDVTDDEGRLINRLLADLEAKTPRNLLRASYYDGKRALRQVGTIIPPSYYRLGLVLGWSAKAVDILARRCNLDGFVWPDGTLDDLGYGYAELADANHLQAEISSAVVSSLIHGVSFLVATKGDDGEPAALIHAKDAMNATGDWNYRRRALDNLLSVTSRTANGKVNGLVLYLDGETVTADVDHTGRWVVDRTTHPWGVPAEPLVYKPRVGRPFGSSRISRPVMSLHNQALRTVIRMEAHNDVYSIPDFWVLGASESDFKNADGSQRAAWQVVIGRLKALPDDEDAAQPRAEVHKFDAASPEPHILTLKQQAQLFSGETSIPLSSLGVSDMSNPTSADSYIASREDLIAEAEGATDDWGPALRRTVVRALAMANDERNIPKEWASIAPKWRSPLYLSRAAQADAGMKQLTAVPWLAETSVGLELLGLDEQQVKVAMGERRRAQAAGVLAGLRTQLDPLVTGAGDNGA